MTLQPGTKASAAWASVWPYALLSVPAFLSRGSAILGDALDPTTTLWRAVVPLQFLAMVVPLCAVGMIAMSAFRPPRGAAAIAAAVALSIPTALTAWRVLMLVLYYAGFNGW